ncbi:amino acid adenylation domain-containing protein [Celeribacter indicus]|uniref:Amino acid adenylation domain-containing protein n=1 Tax=Celeribacter indicus TaxID=1208324 RepID=A0A0B5E0D8_9RHOB|nr:amino acid adenylation domain-containing protein [Celeribacter indicus]AJE48699.1 amino acid adenylation domain-containing protein [Celeribacter indicus]SDX12648.1 amino acid adenylation domain-containing protein [Celeribacter indicus]
MSKDLVFSAPPRRLVHLEKRIFAHEQVGELAPFATERLVLGFDARWSSGALHDALGELLDTHPAFTARFEIRPGGEVLRHGDGRTELTLRGAGTVADAEATTMAHRPNLTNQPAFADLWSTPEGGHILALTLHPLLADDGVCASIERRLWAALGTEGIAADAGEDTGAPDPATERDTRARYLSSWQGLLDSYAIARLPHRPDPQDDGGRIRRSRRLAPDLSARIAERDTEAVLATATALLLHRYSGLDALRFALGQHAGDAYRHAGVMPLCVAPDPARGFAETEARVARIIAEGRAHLLPAEVLVQDRLSRADADRHPLGALSLHVLPARDLPEGVIRHIRPVPPSAEEVVLIAEDTPEGLYLAADADAGLFTEPQIVRLLTHLERIVAAGLAQPDRPTGRIDLLSREELDTLSAPYPDDTPIDPRATHEIIAAHARTTPDKLAVICGPDRLTHGALDARANALAHRLVALGVGAEIPVAILIERGAEAVVAILAAMKAGGAYIPVEPDHPQSRNHHILTDAGVRVVFTRRRYLGRLPEGLSAEVLCLENFTDPPRADAPDVTIHPDQLAYIMYTSGSTGKPKGVAVEHGPLSAHNQTTARVYEMSAESRELPFLPFSSDGGHERWMVPLMMGGSVVIPDGPLWTPEQTLTAMREHGCNNASIPTTYLQQLAEWAEETDSAPPMRLYSFGGEGLAQSTFDLLSRALRAKTLINGYGPTETIMTPMVWKVASGTRFEGVYAPLGRAVGDRRAYVLDAAMMPCPQGLVGEIHLGGTGMARGYVGKPDVTADRFIPDPFGPVLDGTSGACLYRTGDLGRWREDGTIDFVGRVDLQVKINGYRIEPGEIEAALLTGPDVSEALVLLREDGGGKRLMAYVVGPEPSAGDALLSGLETKLPRHMLPEAVIVLDRMPTNPNAKLDRAALPMAAPKARKGAGVPPEGATEETILAIWRETVGTPDMGVTDDFFAMGGKSLLALKALAAMRRHWPATALTIADLFDAPTVRAIAARIEAGGGQTGRTAIALRATGTKPRLYCFPGLLVSTREYLRLTDYLGPDQPVTGFLCHSLNEEKRLNVSVEEVVAEYVAHIRAESAGRPVAFLGWSWGGLLAWEAARQLQGEVDLRLLGMVDVCDLGTDFMPGVAPQFAAGERERLEEELREWLGKTRMRAQWDRLIGAMDAECHAQFLRFIANERDPLPFDGPEISSREHTFWVLIDNALVFRRHRPGPLEVPVASFSAGDSLSRGLNLVDWRRLSPQATPAEVVAGTNHLHIIGESRFHARFRARLEAAFGD